MASSRLFLAFLVVSSAVHAGCQRGEKSCRYYSLVLERGESMEDRKAAIDAIKKMTPADMAKCDDDRVYERFKKQVDDNKFRPMVIETMEVLGRQGGKLRDRSEALLRGTMSRNDAAGQAATVIRTWRSESVERNQPWSPTAETSDEMAKAIKRMSGPTAGQNAGAARSQLVEALFDSLPVGENVAFPLRDGRVEPMVMTGATF